MSWNELLSAALIGTDRRPITFALLDPLRTLVPGEETAGPHRVLDAAAAMTVVRRAGNSAIHGVRVPPPAPDESGLPVPPPAAARLRGLLTETEHRYHAEQQHAALLLEWLGLAAAYGLRVPGYLLPDLLEHARTRAEVRPLAAAVGGQRAYWLAGLRPEWAWVRGESAPDGSEESWYDGTVAERTAYLDALRMWRPDRARDLLAEAWPDEPPAGRTALMATLATGLGPEDEAFCEAALDDRRKEVRTIAAQLLGALPGSAYQRRMSARALECVRVGHGGELLVTPPSTCDSAMRRDGIEVKPPHGTGERSWWLAEIVQRTPLPTWTAALGGEPASLLARSVAVEWRATLHRAWVEATVAQRDSAWAAAFVDADFGRGPNAQALDALLAMSLYEVLSAEDVVSLTIAALEDNPKHLQYLVAACPRPWPEPLCSAVLEALCSPMSRSVRQEICAQAALAMPPHHAADVRRVVEALRADEPDHDWPYLDEIARTLTLRHEMHQEFA